jgi:hypothetical protein
MKTKILSLVLLCTMMLGFTSCKDAEADAKEAASAYCKRKELSKSIVQSQTNNKTMSALLTKMNKIRQRYYNKTTRSFDKKFDEAFEKYKAECR